MQRLLAAFVLASLALVPRAARADRGALTVEAGGGVSGAALPAPTASGAATGGPTLGTSLAAVGSARYAVTNWLEVSATGFYEPPVTYWHNGVDLATANGSFPGTLKHQVHRFGGLVGGRVVRGMVFRVIAGVELGLAHRSYSGLMHINDADPQNAFDYGLGLADQSSTSFVLSPLAGLEWAGGDHWSLSLVPRLQWELAGAQAVTSLVLPLTFSWNFYL